jgi:hypothetical protein
VSGSTDTTASLSWDAASDDIGVAGYTVYRDGTATGTTTSTSFTDTGLAPTTIYGYTVDAFDAAGNHSDLAGPATATTLDPPPAPPTITAVKVQYDNDGSKPVDKRITPGFRLMNTGTAAVQLSEITIRYWFTRDGGASAYAFCASAQVGCASVTQAVTNLSPSRPGADAYLEVGFTGGTLAPGQSTEVHVRVRKTDNSNFKQRDDYSYGANTSLQDSAKVTAYRAGVLLWGSEPAGGGLALGSARLGGLAPRGV